MTRGESPGLICRAPDCSSTTLIDAHIIPRGFARTLSAPGGHNLAVRPSGAKPAKQPLGPFDPAILCGPCDTALGKLDSYAIALCRDLPMSAAAETGSLFRHAPFDGSRFALAMLAIFWRASISNQDQWSHIALGPYEARAGDVLFGDQDLAAIPGFEVALLRYASNTHDARKFAFMPLRIRSGALNVLTLGIGGFLVAAKFDQRPHDPRLRPFIINQAKSLAARFIPFEETAEYSYFQDAAAADRRRLRRSSTR